MKCLLFLLPLMLVSCAKNEQLTQRIWRKSPGAWVNGAEIFSNVEPLRGEGIVERKKLVYMASTHDFDGPMRWQILAEGAQGDHLSMRVDGMQVSTSKSKRSVRIPKELLGGENFFELEEVPRSKRKGSTELEEGTIDPKPRWLASYTLPNILQLYPKADGKVVVAVKVIISTQEGSQSEWVNFAMLPNVDQTKSFTFRQTMVEYDGVPID